MSEFFGEDGFTADDLGGLVDVGTQVWGLGEDIFGNSSDTDIVAEPGTYVAPATDYTPYYIGGGLLVVGLIFLGLYIRNRRRKRKGN